MDFGGQEKKEGLQENVKAQVYIHGLKIVICNVKCYRREVIL